MRDLAVRLPDQPAAEIACRHAAEVLGKNPLDIPFAAIYLLDNEGTSAHLAVGTRLNDCAALFPADHPVGDGNHPWPLGQVAKTGLCSEVSNVPASIGVCPTGPWPDPVETAFVLPLGAPTQPRPVGFLIVGVSPRRVLDPDYRSFLELVSRPITTNIVDARAFEAERARVDALAAIDEELASMSRLNELSTRLTATSDLPSLLSEALDAVMELQEADFGTIQLYETDSETFEIFAQRGFTEDFLEYCRTVGSNAGSACAMASRDGKRVIIQDVLVHPEFAPHRPIAAHAGSRAVQSTPLVDGNSGSIVGMLSTHFRKPHRPSGRELRLTDLYARQAADLIGFRLSERRLRENEVRLKAAVELLALGCYAWDPRDNTLSWDSRVKAMWGLPPDASVDYQLWRGAIHPDDVSRVDEAVRKSMDLEQDGIYEVDYRVIGVTDGVERWVATRGTTTFENGAPVAFFGVALDVTARKRSEQGNLLLIGELQHRTRNLLAVVQAISQKTVAASKSLDDYSDTFGGRLAALSRVQGLLSRGDITPVTIGELVRLELEALAADPHGGRVRLEGPDVALPPGAVQILALALHELATNARKYGALGAPEGSLAVTWRTTNEAAVRRLSLEWHEHRVVTDTDMAPPVHRGFGRTLIEDALPYQLDAETRLEFAPDGVFRSVTITLDS